jgi:hypothetical protein
MRELYGTAIDDVMCSPYCPCDPAFEEIFKARLPTGYSRATYGYNGRWYNTPIDVNEEKGYRLWGNETGHCPYDKTSDEPYYDE